MPRLIIVCIFLGLFYGKTFSQKATTVKQLPEVCLSQTEIELYKLINEYRVQKGLPEVKLSVSLSFVARTHAIDQTGNYKSSTRCNLHSWSDKGSWSSFCYTADHKNVKKMWNKPRELTNYQGDGFEISYYSTYNYPSPQAFAKDILEGWKKSPNHNNVILNKNIWKNVRWQAIGIGVYGEYADVWFGKEEDKAGAPLPCAEE